MRRAIGTLFYADAIIAKVVQPRIHEGGTILLYTIDTPGHDLLDRLAQHWYEHEASSLTTVVALNARAICVTICG